jgi:hypothetical protein
MFENSNFWEFKSWDRRDARTLVLIKMKSTICADWQRLMRRKIKIKLKNFICNFCKEKRNQKKKGRVDPVIYLVANLQKMVQEKNVLS